MAKQSSTPRPKDVTRIDGFDSAKWLCDGASSDVYKVTRGNDTFALKLFKPLYPVEKIFEELEILKIVKTVGCKHICKFYKFYESGKQKGFLLEYCEGQDLFEALIGKQFSEQRVRNIMKQILEAITALHSKNIIHRDLKPENVLLQVDGTVKILDFGHTFKHEDNQRICGTKRTVLFYGTPEYAAPEACDVRYPFCGPEADVFALGVLLYELLTRGSRPFLPQEFSIKDFSDVYKAFDYVFNSILRPRSSLSLPSPLPCSREALSLMTWMMHPWYHGRPTAEQALKHSWFEAEVSTKALLSLDGTLKNVTRRLKGFFAEPSESDADGLAYGYEEYEKVLRSMNEKEQKKERRLAKTGR